MTPAETEGYFRSLTELKQEYSRDIKIYIGFEAEYIPQLVEAQDKLLADYPLDYMIMGQHFNDPEYDGAYMGAPVYEESLLIQYVDRIIEGMESGRYRYIAHPDLIRYMGGSEEYEKHMTRLCTFLKALYGKPSSLLFAARMAFKGYPQNPQLLILRPSLSGPGSQE